MKKKLTGYGWQVAVEGVLLAIAFAIVMAIAWWPVFVGFPSRALGNAVIVMMLTFGIPALFNGVFLLFGYDEYDRPGLTR